MKTLFVSTLVILAVMPARADAACGVPAARAEFETPELQVYARGTGLRACLRATGRDRLIGSHYDDGDTYEVDTVSAVFGGRYVWTTFGGFYGESADVRQETMTDLRTGQHVTVRTQDEEVFGVDVVAAGGVLVTDAGGGITALYTDGRKVRLSEDPAAIALGIAGARVYWKTGAQAHTAVLDLPPGDPARPRPLARTIGRCKPHKGARLVARSPRIVVTSAGTYVWLCRAGKTRRLRHVSDMAIEADESVRYRRADTIVLKDPFEGNVGRTR
jgi:hypothetical protein